MTQPGVGPGADRARPSVARVYDCLLGGVTNFPADRAVAAMMRQRAPELVDAAFANRGFHQRAARWIAEQGILQFIDIGSGLPTVGNTHEVVRKVAPLARVVYVDNDPMAAWQGTELLAGDKNAAVVLADLREPGNVLGAEEVRRLIDFAEPVGVMMTGVLHFVSDADDPAGLVASYMAPAAAGSCVALSHMTGDHKPPQAVAVILAAGSQSAGGAYMRSRAEVRRLFGGLELIPPYDGADPDVTWVGLWNCEDPELADSEGSRWLYSGVATKA
jgi:S-adenosyl methyltransferase